MGPCLMKEWMCSHTRYPTLVEMSNMPHTPWKAANICMLSQSAAIWAVIQKVEPSQLV